MAKQLGWLPKLRILEEEIGEEEAGVERLKNPPQPWWETPETLSPEEQQRRIIQFQEAGLPYWSKFEPPPRKTFGETLRYWNERLPSEITGTPQGVPFSSLTPASQAMKLAESVFFAIPGTESMQVARGLSPVPKWALRAVAAPAFGAEKATGFAAKQAVRGIKAGAKATGRAAAPSLRAAKLAPQRGAIGKEPLARKLPEVYIKALREQAEDAVTARQYIKRAKQAYAEGDIMALEELGLEEASKELQQKIIRRELAKPKLPTPKAEPSLPEKVTPVTPPSVTKVTEIQTGKPFTMRLYRGETTHLRDIDRGVFMTPDRETANIYAGIFKDTPGARVTIGNESFQNPVVFESKRDVGRFLGYTDDPIGAVARKRADIGETAFDDEVAWKARQLGHDAIVYTKSEGGVGSVVDLRLEAPIPKAAGMPEVTAAKPLEAGVTLPPPPEVPPVAKMLPQEADDLIAQFVKIIKSPKAEEAWELTKELRRPIHARRFAAFGDEYRRLVDQGMAVDEAIQKATVQLKGKYPLQSLSLNDSPELRQALFTKLDKVARETNMLEGEVIATAKALENALKKGNIPRTPGIKGGSAYTRLLKVFDKEVVDILDKPGKLVDILLGPVEQIDREALDAFAKLPDIGQQLPMIPVGKRAKFLAALQKAGVNIIESFNLVRAFRSSYDLSMPFRQGLAAGVRHPVNWLRAWKPMVKALVNEDFATAFNKSLTADADVAEAVAKDWLDMISLERAAPYMRRLESFASRWAESIPGVRQSQRAAATFVNALMVDNYKAGVKVLKMAGADPSEFKAFAELVNISVGRGSIPKFAQRFAPTLNALLFSPRLLAARLELPFKLASSSPMVRKEAAKTMVSLLGFGALVLGLFKMAGGKPEFDPRGTEVGKVRIGNTRLDFWGGYIQYVRFMGQLLSGKRKTTEGTIQEVDRARLITRFFQSKEAPMLSLFTDLISGETFSGEKVSFTPKGIGKLAYENLAPFGISDFIEAVMEEGELGIIPGILAQTGVGAVTYGEKQKGGKIDLGGLKIPKFEEFKLRPSGSEGFDLSKLKIPKFEESKLR